jgi:hypothetical protein
MKVLLYDKTDKLTPFWAMGRILSRWDAVIAATSWRDAIEQLAALPRPVTHLQFWGHGAPGMPGIDGIALGNQLVDFVGACRFPPEATVWWRACNVFQGPAGQQFAKHFCKVAKCGHVGHTRVVSAPWPIYQSGGYGLRPGQMPHWSAEDSGGSGPRKPNTCLVTRMTVPSHWWR